MIVRRVHEGNYICQVHNNNKATLSRLSVFVLQRRGSIENIASVKERIENYMSATTAVAADGETSMQPPPIKELLKSPLSPPHQTRPKSILVSPG